ncbi:MAG: RyR domain-containing protein, partial [Thiogranum sp.]
DKTPDPVMQFTDLCGARIITQTQSQVRVFSEFVEQHFLVDWDNSVDISQRQKPAEFGYRSVHYIIQLQPDVFPTDEIDVLVPRALLPGESRPMKVEIQIRTLLEHAWADFYHEWAYKPEFRIPEKSTRDLAALAAILEDADRSFERIQSDLDTYARGAGGYMDSDTTRKEIEHCNIIVRANPDNNTMVLHQARLIMSLGEWSDAVDLLASYRDSDDPAFARAYGTALCRKHRDAPEGGGYKKALLYLKQACDSEAPDPVALAALAEGWWPLDRKKAGVLWCRAFELDPANPALLAGFLCDKIGGEGHLSQIAMMTPAIKAALQRCHDFNQARVNLPMAWFHISLFSLLLGCPHDSVHACARAIQLSISGHTIADALDQLQRLAVVRAELPGYDWVERLLLVGSAAKFPTDGALDGIKRLASKHCKPIQGSVVIVAGGCDSRVEGRMDTYRKLILEAFRDFRGTVISAGTNAGISGLVGDVQAEYTENILTLAYIPQKPRGVTIDKKRFREIRRTGGDDFSIFEPLQNWIDLIASGVDIAQVRLVGVNGGKIAAAEYRIGLALGAQVGIIEGSGRDAARLLQDDDWKGVTNLLPMPAEPATLRAFIGAGKSMLEAPLREAVARSVHEEYRRMQSDPEQSTDPSMLGWENLLDDLKDSSLQAAGHIPVKLARINCGMRRVEDREITLMTFTDKEIETMSEMEHGRWNIERIRKGWRFGEEKDVERKISPYLVAWDELPEKVKDRDRRLVKKIPLYLAAVGMEIVRL